MMTQLGLFKLVFFIALLFSQSISIAQVGVWPPNSQYYHFGAPELNQSDYRNYALLQDKINGYTFLNSPSTLYFRILNSDKMILTGAGNFGIGTTSPGYQLHVKSPDVQMVVQTDGTGNNRGIVAFGDASGVLKGSIGLFGADETIRIGDAMDYRMVIKQGGNIGIGTTNPSQKFHVQGDNPNNEVGIKVENINSNPSSSAPIQFKTGASANVWQAFARNSDFTIGVANVADYMVIKNGGNVGIGTTNPDSKLTVKGTIHSKEVKVDLNGSVAPDYVFEKDYPLTSLEELKSYIDQNKHLPEVPSAKEMEEDGINLKEMNLLLLKKMEELTLYLIDQRKNLLHEKEINQQQAMELAELKMQLKIVLNKK